MTRSRAVLAWRSPAAWVTLLSVFAVGLAFDLSTKSWSFRNVASKPVELVYETASVPSFKPDYHEPVHALPWDLLDFSLVVNHGAVFGLGQNRRSVFVVFTIGAIAVALWVFGWWTNSKSRVAHVGIGLVLAGGIGNLHDRLVYGAVRDFLHMLPRWQLPFGLRWPGGNAEIFPWVFNVADVELLAGMGLLLLAVRASDRAARTAERPAATSTNATETSTTPGTGAPSGAIIERPKSEPAP